AVEQETGLRLNPRLDAPEIDLLALFDTNQARISDLLTDQGPLTPGWAPVRAAQIDRRTQKSMAQIGDPYLFLTADLANTIVLRALGLPAVPISGFEDFLTSDWEFLIERAGFVAAPQDVDLDADDFPEVDREDDAAKENSSEPKDSSA